MPCEWVGQMVSTRLYPGQVVIVADDGVMARHERLSNKGETRDDWQHYIPLVQRKPGALRNGASFQDLPEPLQRLRRVLLREAGVDRVMAHRCWPWCPALALRLCWWPSSWPWRGRVPRGA